MTSAKRTIVPFRPRQDQRNREELAFLPAALEIVETPPSPLGRATVYTIIVLFCIGLVWSIIGRIDIVATATGKIIPSGRTKVVQPLEVGVVRAIHVRDGQAVKAGEVLIELDSTMNQAEQAHLAGDLMAAELDVARLNAALTQEGDPLAAFHPPEGASATQVAMQRSLLMQQIGEQSAKVATLDRQKAQKEAELGTANATVGKLEKLIPVLSERVEIRRTLYSHDTGSKASYLELYQQLVETQQDLTVQKSRANESEAAVAAITQQRLQAEAEFRRDLYTDLVEAQRKANGLREDLIKATQRTQLQVLTAPVDGTVQQLAVHTIGGVVTAAQSLMMIVPNDSRLEVDANLNNRDIGFVQPGQDAEIKVDTFNFTKYGLLHGKVLSVSHDAIQRDKPLDKSGDKPRGQEDSTSEPLGQELVFSARVSLDRTQMQVDDREVNLSPGMAVTVEIKTGSRRMIEYLLSPLLKYRQESLRDR
ncbi:MAG: HlyD family type I secretion periplasmic adaptor subunit [Xanthobacteraceae bacterium]|nr:HlyD family type I secretion periplasmic adaptor subunit [Xanthobacteraceae bacterium]